MQIVRRMKIMLASLVVFAISICNPRAESFSSSTNFVRTLIIGTNEAIFVTTLKQSGPRTGAPDSSVVEVNVSRSNQTVVLPIKLADIIDAKRPLPAFAGPMDIQFQQANVLMEFQRIRTTNVFTTLLNSSNGVTITVPAGKTINFVNPTSWNLLGGKDSAQQVAGITLSNSITVLKDAIWGNENFTGPLTITLFAGAPWSPDSSYYTDGWVTYYFTEEFAALPNVGATAVPTGKSVIAIEKSQDLVHWGTAFFTIVGSDQTGFYRFNISK